MKILTSSPNTQRGLGLIEVMVSVLVLALGLLGVAAMQALALRGGQGSLESTQAVMASNSIIEAMRVNRANAGSYAYDGTAACNTVPAAGTSLATNDINHWVTELKTTIGNNATDTTTCGKIVNDGGGKFTVTVQWDDSRAGGGSTRQVTTEAVI